MFPIAAPPGRKGHGSCLTVQTFVVIHGAVSASPQSMGIPLSVRRTLLPMVSLLMIHNQRIGTSSLA